MRVSLVRDTGTLTWQERIVRRVIVGTHHRERSWHDVLFIDFDWALLELPPDPAMRATELADTELGSGADVALVTVIPQIRGTNRARMPARSSGVRLRSSRGRDTRARPS